MSVFGGTTRGLHFQWPPYSETKIVSCAIGRLFDVAVDLRKGSRTYLEHYTAELTAENKQFLVIPEGFAHGFQTLEPGTEILYLVTQDYSLEHDDGINPKDPLLAINWPLSISSISPKDEFRDYIVDRSFSGVHIE
jgi:dTDP-4-dehydrorhamnose 3,5-epimerase